MARKKTKNDDSKIFAFLATFLSIIGFLIAVLAKKEDKYVMYYASHSLVIFIITILAGVAEGIFGWIPILGWIIAAGLNIFIFVLWLLSWIYALSGKEKEIPLITTYAKKIKL